MTTEPGQSGGTHRARHDPIRLSPRSPRADDVVRRTPEARRSARFAGRSRVGDAHMIEQAYDRDSVRQYVEAVRGALGSDQLREAKAAAAQAIPGGGDPQAMRNAPLA